MKPLLLKKSWQTYLMTLSNKTSAKMKLQCLTYRNSPSFDNIPQKESKQVRIVWSISFIKIFKEITPIAWLR